MYKTSAYSLLNVSQHMLDRNLTWVLGKIRINVYLNQTFIIYIYSCYFSIMIFSPSLTTPPLR